MRRREFMAGFGSSVAWPAVARAQQPAMPVIGFVHAASADASAGVVAAFRKGLGETGYGKRHYPAPHAYQGRDGDSRHGNLRSHAAHQFDSIRGRALDQCFLAAFPWPAAPGAAS
jgi:hypothetical protein